MTPTQEFIEDAATGGCELAIVIRDHSTEMENYGDLEKLLLDPLAWQAVGKTRGWRERSENTFEAEMSCWQAYWTAFFQHLADGKSIEEALSAIK